MEAWKRQATASTPNEARPHCREAPSASSRACRSQTRSATPLGEGSAAAALSELLVSSRSSATRSENSASRNRLHISPPANSTPRAVEARTRSESMSTTRPNVTTSNTALETGEVAPAGGRAGDAPRSSAPRVDLQLWKCFGKE